MDEQHQTGGRDRNAHRAGHVEALFSAAGGRRAPEHRQREQPGYGQHEGPPPAACRVHRSTEHGSEATQHGRGTGYPTQSACPGGAVPAGADQGHTEDRNRGGTDALHDPARNQPTERRRCSRDQRSGRHEYDAGDEGTAHADDVRDPAVHRGEHRKGDGVPADHPGCARRVYPEPCRQFGQRNGHGRRTGAREPEQHPDHGSDPTRHLRIAVHLTADPGREGGIPSESLDGARPRALRTLGARCVPRLLTARSPSRSGVTVRRDCPAAPAL
ncbi:MAG TPA: hypothetical protein VE645_11265 [Pseudonocardiaceae bacterium]|nr:hypothetical protein [Pseudonocardiaceae bacterium]